MKTLLAAILLLTSLSSFAVRVPMPQCKDDLVLYEGPNHLFADFCINDRGISNPVECVKYQQNADPKLLEKEIVAFLTKRHAKVCGQ